MDSTNSERNDGAEKLDSIRETSGSFIEIEREFEPVEKELWDNFRRAADKTDSSFLSFAIFAALFILVASGSAGKLVLFGSSVDNPRAFLWVLNVLAAYNFYNACLYASFGEQISRYLWKIEARRRTAGEVWFVDRLHSAGVFDLLMPPSLLGIVTSRAIQSDGDRGLSNLMSIFLWFVLVPCAFFGWAIYLQMKQAMLNSADGLPIPASLLVAWLCWRSLRTIWTGMRGANRGS